MTKNEIMITSIVATLIMLFFQYGMYRIAPYLGAYDTGVAVSAGAAAAFIVIGVMAKMRGLDDGTN